MAVPKRKTSKARRDQRSLEAQRPRYRRMPPVPRKETGTQGLQALRLL